ncbi:epoxide hydrolase 3-like isoform X1 [Dioscorea cayenensis subsp. rotundata]|uniref:Epoxide hydrolase 3-like isoform X1 n=1 Tax=Dioscorea cayennensis subsp. rotundata TaxID=55577 RepID=A0AB40AKW6_DIOCR|nr:epoxide hydrolase 3-like isoform X1 [Dioscorea cayenensis subsp. rotundata]
MVNLVEAQKPLLHFLLKLAGLRPTTVEIDPGTVMSFWVPKTNQYINEIKKTKKKKKKKDKPSVVLVHGFAAEGIVTWQFQLGALTNKYDVYVPDLLYFGGSKSSGSERSPEFQAQCLGSALARLGVARCAVVGFSYGGMVAFKLAEMWPELVSHLVVSGSVIAMTDSMSDATLQRLGFASSAELLLPDSVKGLKALLTVATYKKLWFPDCIHRDYLQVMFGNRKERAELLEGLVMSNKDAVVPVLPQRIMLLWGENDNIFNIELAKNMKEQLGEKATLQSISKAGHLVHLERPCAYNRHLKEFLAQIVIDDPINNK